MHIRDVQAEDAAAICRINREALGYEFGVEDTRAQLERIIKAPNIVLFVAVDDTDVLGYIQLSDYENTYHRPLKNLITLATGLNRMDARKFYAANGYEVRKEQTNLIKWWS